MLDGLSDSRDFSIITWSWEITFIPLWIVLCISLVGVLYTIIFAGILLRMPDVNADQRRFDQSREQPRLTTEIMSRLDRPLTLPWATASSWCLSWSSSSSSLTRWTRLSRSHTSLQPRLSFSPSSLSSSPVLVAEVSCCTHLSCSSHLQSFLSRR